jgi:hypothetical protein
MRFGPKEGERPVPLNHEVVVDSLLLRGRAPDGRSRKGAANLFADPAKREASNQIAAVLSRAAVHGMGASRSGGRRMNSPLLCVHSISRGYPLWGTRRSPSLRAFALPVPRFHCRPPWPACEIAHQFTAHEIVMRFGPCSLFIMSDSVLPGWSTAKNGVSRLVNIGLTQRF